MSEKGKYQPLQNVERYETLSNLPLVVASSLPAAANGNLKNMKLTNKDVIKNTLVNINQLQEHQKNVLSALFRVRALADNKIECGDLLNELLKQELYAWQQLCMWGLTLEPDEHADIKALVHARMLSDRNSVSAYLSEDGVTPSSWLAKDETEFRAMCAAHFGKGIKQ